MNPNDYTIYAARSAVYSKLGDFDKALDDAKQTI